MLSYGDRIATWLAALGLFALLGFALPAHAQGQGEGEFSFDGQGGVAFAAGELADVTDAGASVGGGVAYWITPRIAVRGDFDANLLQADDTDATMTGEGPDMNLLHYNGGLQVAITDPRSSPWDVSLNVGGGATTIDADAFKMPQASPNGGAGSTPVDFTETYLAFNGGLGVGYDVSENVAVFVDGQWYLTLTDEDDTAVFNVLSPEVDADGFDTASAVPITLGLRIRTD